MTGLARAVASGFPALDPARHGPQGINPFSLDASDGIQTRADLNERSVAAYAEAMRRGDEFPPALVYVVEGKARLVDGFHRHLASMESIDETKRPFRVEVRIAILKEAMTAALTTNTKHGTRLTQRDNENRLKMACAEPELRAYSNRKLADFLGVDRNWIQRQRAKHAWARRDGFSEGRPSGPDPLEPLSKLPPLAVPFYTPSVPPALSEAAWGILERVAPALEWTAQRPRKATQEVARQVAALTLEKLELSGEALDQAIAEVAKVGVWLYQARRRGEIKTAPECRKEAEEDAL